MAKKQTRRAISLKEETYQQVTAFCQQHGVSRSGFVEEITAAFFEEREPMFAGPANKADKADRVTPQQRGRLPKIPEPKAAQEPPRGGGVHSL